ncbi:hypothetical protein RUND412_008508, partial [Rhizina undulata]
HFTRHENFLVDDENNACVEGDVVRIEAGYRSSSSKHHMVTEILSPFRTGEERKSVETPEEWLRRQGDKRAAKLQRRAESERDSPKVKHEKWSRERRQQELEKAAANKLQHQEMAV